MRKIIIIGASSGLGARIAADFAAAGWQVGVAARREQPLKELSEAYPDGRVVYKTIDVTAVDAVGRFGELIEAAGGMDTLLLCSGTGFYDPNLEDGKLCNTLMVNCVGFARIVAAAYRYMRDTVSNHRRQIAAITSVAGTKGIGVSAAYSASKRFQQQFLDAVDQLAHQQGVDVAITDIRPGFVRTPLLESEKDYPMLMELPYAARLIERAIVREKRVAVIDWRWSLLNGVWQLIPLPLWRKATVDFND